MLEGYQALFIEHDQHFMAQKPGFAQADEKVLHLLDELLAQAAIEKAEQGDYTEIELLLTVLRAPFDGHTQLAHYTEPPPAGIDAVQVNCSS